MPMMIITKMRAMPAPRIYLTLRTIQAHSTKLVLVLRTTLPVITDAVSTVIVKFEASVTTRARRRPPSDEARTEIRAFIAAA